MQKAGPLVFACIYSSHVMLFLEPVPRQVVLKRRTKEHQKTSFSLWFALTSWAWRTDWTLRGRSSLKQGARLANQKVCETKESANSNNLHLSKRVPNPRGRTSSLGRMLCWCEAGARERERENNPLALQRSRSDFYAAQTLLA